MNPRVSTLTLLAVLLFAVAALHHEGEHSDFKTLLKQQTRFEYKLTKIEKGNGLDYEQAQSGR